MTNGSRVLPELRRLVATLAARIPAVGRPEPTVERTAAANRAVVTQLRLVVAFGRRPVPGVRRVVPGLGRVVSRAGHPIATVRVPGTSHAPMVPHEPPSTSGWDDDAVSARTAELLHRGRLLEAATLAWNVVGIVVLAVAAVRAHSVALAGFGLDSLIEIGASVVVLWELSGTGDDRQRRALRLIGAAFVALAVYLLVQASIVLAVGYHPEHSPLGIAWTAITAAAMFALAHGKRRTGEALGNPVLTTEARVTVIDGLLASAVLLGLVLNAGLGWWWADPAAGLVIVYYAVREAWIIYTRH